MTLFFEINTVGVILKYVLALSSFIMAVNGVRDFEAQKSASIHHKKCFIQLRGFNKGHPLISGFHESDVQNKNV